MAAFRKVLFWMHLICGVVAGAVVLIMSVTGVLLTYEKQMNAWSRTRNLPAAASSNGQSLPLSQLLAKLNEAGLTGAAAITVNAERPHLAEVELPKRRTVFVDRSTGQMIAESQSALAPFFSSVTGLHRYLGATGPSRGTGKAITGASNLAFLFIVLSGFYLWWPKLWNRPQFRNILMFRGGLSGKARDFNWHNVIGIWSFIPLALVVLSGVVISYSWASNLVFKVAGEAPPTQGGPPGPPRDAAPRAAADIAPVQAADLDARWAFAEKQLPGWTTLSLRLPNAAAQPVTFSFDHGSGVTPQTRTQVTYDQSTGEQKKIQRFSDESPGRRLRIFLRFAHTGEFFGFIGQTIAGLVTAGACVLVWTGIALSWRRYRNWRKVASLNRDAHLAAR